MGFLNPKDIHIIFAAITVHPYPKDMQGIGSLKLLDKCCMFASFGVQVTRDLAPSE